MDRDKAIERRETTFLYECTNCGGLIRDTYHAEDRECPACGRDEFRRRERLWYGGKDPREMEGDDDDW